MVTPSAPIAHGRGDSAPITAIERLALVCFFFSGLAGLVYQVCWIRMSSLVFGSATQAVATVLGVFFLGWALGSWLIGSYAGSTQRPLRAYAVLEGILGVTAALSPLLFALADRAYGAVYERLLDHPAMLTVVRAGIVTLLLLAPATVMGGTLPLYVAHFSRRAERLGRSIGWLYALNTAGAVVGCLLAGFVLVPVVGTKVSIWMAAAVNIAIAAVLWNAPPHPEARDRAEKAAEESVGGVVGGVRVLVAVGFFLSGLAFVAYEVAWTRYLSLLMRNSVHTYTITLGVILAGIVVGSLLAGQVIDRGALARRRALVWGVAQALTGLSVLAVVMLPPGVWGDVFSGANLGTRVGVVMAVMFLPAVLAGAAYPIAIRVIVSRPELAPKGVGSMTALNTLGGIVGSVVCGFVLLPRLGLHATLLILTGLSVGLALGGWWWGRLIERRSAVVAAVLSVIAIGVWVAIPMASGVKLPQAYLLASGESPEALVAVREGVASNMAVIKRGSVLQLEMDRLWQGEDRKNHQVMSAHVPMLLHGADTPRVLVVGLGTGTTPSRFLHYPSVKELVVVDIEAALFDLVREHFAGVVAVADATCWLDDPRVRSIAEDGRNYISHGGGAFDVISIEVGQTFRPGVAAFYSVEFYERCLERLAPEGLVCQFIPVGYFTPEELRRVVASFTAVFPQCVLWYNATEPMLIGRKGASVVVPGSGPARFAQVPSVEEDLRYSQWGGEGVWLSRPGAFFGGMLLGPDGLRRLTIGAEARAYHDDPPVFEYSASGPRPVMEGGLEAANVALIRAVGDADLDAVSAVLSDSERSEAVRVRERNLDDMVAWPAALAGQAARREGKTAEAVGAFRAALERNPENVLVRRSLAESLGAMPWSPATTAAYTEALALAPGDRSLAIGLARVSVAQGQPAQAIAALRAAVAANPGDVEVRRALGKVLNLAGRGAEGVAVWDAMLTDPPHPPHPAVGTADDWFERGIAYTAAGRAPEAMDSYRLAIGKDPKFARAHANLGDLHNRAGERDEAIAALRAAVAADPTLVAAVFNLGAVLSVGSTQELTEGVVLLERAARLKPDLWQAQHQHGVALMRMGQPEPALAALERAARLQPGNARVATDFARAMLMLGQVDRAEGVLRGVLVSHPDFGPAKNGLGVVEAMRGGVTVTPEQIEERMR